MGNRKSWPASPLVTGRPASQFISRPKATASILSHPSSPSGKHDFPSLFSVVLLLLWYICRPRPLLFVPALRHLYLSFVICGRPWLSISPFAILAAATHLGAPSPWRPISPPTPRRTPLLSSTPSPAGSPGPHSRPRRPIRRLKPGKKYGMGG